MILVAVIIIAVVFIGKELASIPHETRVQERADQMIKENHEIIKREINKSAGKNIMQ